MMFWKCPHWSLLTGGHYSEMVISTRLTVLTLVHICSFLYFHIKFTCSHEVFCNVASFLLFNSKRTTSSIRKLQILTITVSHYYFRLHLENSPLFEVKAPLSFLLGQRRRQGNNRNSQKKSFEDFDNAELPALMKDILKQSLEVEDQFPLSQKIK
jgi:hypothetical protein